jgi:hypothetical protein
MFEALTGVQLEGITGVINFDDVTRGRKEGVGFVLMNSEGRGDSGQQVGTYLKGREPSFQYVEGVVEGDVVWATASRDKVVLYVAPEAEVKITQEQVSARNAGEARSTRAKRALRKLCCCYPIAAGRASPAPFCAHSSCVKIYALVFALVFGGMLVYVLYTRLSSAKGSARATEANEVRKNATLIASNLADFLSDCLNW